MEEVYTCICGNQEWIILGSRVQCAKCKKYYNYDDLVISSITFCVSDFTVTPTPRIFNFAMESNKKI